MEFVLGGSAAVCAGFFTNPFEVMKIRMQLQGELQARGHYAVYYRNVLHAGYVIAKHDGILAIQKGLVPALWFQLVLNSSRFGSYQIINGNGLTKVKNGDLVFWKNLLAAELTGCAGVCFGSPFILVKTRVEVAASIEIAVGYQRKHIGMLPALKKIYLEQGMRGLFRGSLAAIPRAIVGQSTQLTSFAYCKEWIKKHDVLQNSPILESIVGSMIGGVLMSIMMTPFDVVATRLYNQGVDIATGKGLFYSGYMDCVIKIWESEGFWGFYKGIGACYVIVGPPTVLYLVFWDKFKQTYAEYKNKHNK